MVLIIKAINEGSGESAHPSLFAHVSMEVDKGSDQNQASSAAGWLRMCV